MSDAEKNKKGASAEDKAAKAAKGKAHAEANKAANANADAGRRSGSKVELHEIPGPGEYAPRFKTRYQDQIRPALMEKFGYKNKLQAPQLDKIVINMGVGEATQDTKKVQNAVRELTMIAGQKPVVTKAKLAISNFKVREGMPLGVKVTLRRDRMYEFLDRLITVALPRVRDFKGISPKAFDGRGNYTLGLREQIIFPEINYDQIEKVKGLNVSIVTSAGNDERALALLKAIGVPFKA